MEKVRFNDDLEKFSYALGLSIAANLIQSGVNTIHPDAFVAAVKDTFTGERPQMDPEEANRILEVFVNGQHPENGNSTKNLEEGLAFLAENKKKSEVVELPSGLQYEVLNEGEGDIPTANDQVRCHYHGTLIDGTVFDSSVQRGKPAVFPVSGVIQGWVEALQLMSVGSKWKLFIPSELAYGQRGAGAAIGPNSTLVFEVELLEIL
ncbi:MAG TPA: FKBP-type peptidyl-prolyl cis-trans isomerase [Draconibacterium sp.]|nr:FKBP-type peptidyl-prolyl cis-trans isomerase [Draconibacterium sp.]